MDTILDVYLERILSKLCRAGVEILADHLVRRIDGESVTLYNVHHEKTERVIHADWILMATAR